MIIEYIGLPGSGKTTYLENKVRSNQEIYTREKLDEYNLDFIHRFKFTIRHFYLYLLFYFGALYNIELRNLTRIKMSYGVFLSINKTLSQHSKANHLLKTDNNVKIILDEGLLQRSVALYCFRNKRLNNSLLKTQLKEIKRLNLIDEIYYFNLSVEESIGRCVNRTDGLPSRFREYEHDIVQDKFELNLKGFELVYKLFPVELINNEEL